MRIGIIGTAGRREDQVRMSENLYSLMIADFKKRLKNINQPITLISGGAAWADHLAVTMFIKNIVTELELYFPCKWNKFKNEFLSLEFRDSGSVANYYHGLFSKKLFNSKYETLTQIAQAIVLGAKIYENTNGFHARNLQVAVRSEILIAYTWGEGQTQKTEEQVILGITVRQFRKSMFLLVL